MRDVVHCVTKAAAAVCVTLYLMMTSAEQGLQSGLCALLAISGAAFLFAGIAFQKGFSVGWDGGKDFMCAVMKREIERKEASK